VGSLPSLSQTAMAVALLMCDLLGTQPHRLPLERQTRKRLLDGLLLARSAVIVSGWERASVDGGRDTSPPGRLHLLGSSLGE
jgi:hypothetical protein